MLSLSTTSIIPLHAQDRDENNNVSMRIDFVSWGENISGLELRDGKSGTPVSALAFQYSKTIEYAGPQLIALAYGEISEAESKKMAAELDLVRRRMEEEGAVNTEPKSLTKIDTDVDKGEVPKALAEARKKDPKLAALVKLPTNSRHVTILLAPGPNKSLIPHILDDDPSKQPLGKIRVHNLSSYPIRLLTNSKKSEVLAPGKNFISEAPSENFIYELAYNIDGKWISQENNLVVIRPNQQVHMVVLRNESSFFTSSDGSRGGYMQTAFLRRTPQ